MVKEEEAFSLKCFRIIVIKTCNPNFHQKFAKLHHSYLQGQQSCSDISVKGRWYLQCTVLNIRKSIWSYLQSHQITIAAEYLPSELSFRAHWKSRNETDLSNWKLVTITKLLGTPTVVLLTSRLRHQRP